MNEKQAREIVRKFEDQLSGRINPIDEFVPLIDAYRAEGYLECLEHVKPLVESLKGIVASHDGCEYTTKDCASSYCCASQMVAVEAGKEGLSRWDEVQK